MKGHPHPAPGHESDLYKARMYASGLNIRTERKLDDLIEYLGLEYITISKTIHGGRRSSYKYGVEDDRTEEETKFVKKTIK